MASLTQWTWVWANPGRQQKTGNPGVLQFLGHKESWIQLRDWTIATFTHSFFFLPPPSLPPSPLSFYRLKERPSMRAVSYVLLGQNEDYSLGDRISDSSEKLLQRGTSAWLTVSFFYLWKKFSVLLGDKVSVIHDFSEGGTCSHAHILAEVCC